MTNPSARILAPFRHAKVAHIEISNTEAQLRTHVADSLERLVVPRNTLSAERTAELSRAFPSYLQTPRYSPQAQKAYYRRLWANVLCSKYAVAPLACTVGYWLLRTRAQMLVRQLSDVSNLVGIPLAPLRNKGPEYIQFWVGSEIINLMGRFLIGLWQRKAYEGYLTQTQQSNLNRLPDWVDEKSRTSLAEAVASTGPEAISGAAHLTDNVAYTIGAICNLFFTMGFAFTGFQYAVLGGAFVGSLGGLLANNAFFLTKLSKKESDQAGEYRNHLNTFSDNVQIANPYNVQKWSQKRQTIRNSFHAAAKLKQMVQYTGQGIGTAIVGVPAMCMVAREMSDSKTDYVGFARGMMTLGKLVSLSVVVKGVVEAAAGFSEVSGKFDRAAKATHANTAEEWNGRMLNMLDRRAGLAVQYRSTASNAGGPQTIAVEDLLADPQRLRTTPGRWTIRAANGVGKTTLGSALMSRLSGLYDYIPVKHRLQFNYNDGSAGQNAINHLAEIIRSSRRRIIFLDEWPANLDPRNSQAVSSLLDRLAQQLCIIEMVPA
jgi:hypothetical protein